MTKDERIRNWTFVLYPESAPADWRDILDAEFVPWVESPLHEMDTDPQGEIKKAHWHILLLYDGKKSYEQIKQLTDSLNAPAPQKVSSAKGLVRYMLHLDNPDKFQYDRSLIVGHGGADVAEYLKPTSASRYILIREMIDYIRQNNVCEMKDLLYYSMENRFDDWFPLLCDNSAYIMSSLLKSIRNSNSAG